MITAMEKGKIVVKQFIDVINSDTFSIAKTKNAPVHHSKLAYAERLVPINVKKIVDFRKLRDYIQS